ncbi:MAG TPA: hypothetical protein VG147_03950 [Solirubrobacteraceae bacterium]|nr:hypothetical protein [Solirubrobacteraceae bacterium]
MAAIPIVTSHPDVACDVCGRRLLRGEQPDVFLGGGQRRMVCELCTTRATHEGWRRETEAHPGRPRADRSQRGRSLLRKLRQLREPVQPVRAGGVEAGDPAESGSAAAGETEWTGIDAEWAAVDEEWGAPEEVGGTPEEIGGAVEHALDPPGAGHTGANVERALAVFNTGEYPRRVAGVARSLGTPTVRATELDGAKVAIVVAWELCWYRYEIDSQDETRGAWLAAEGMELEELAEDDRIANAVADERGELSLLA